MKRITALRAILYCSSFLFAQTTLTIEVQVKDIVAGGVIRAALCANEAAFTTEKGCAFKAVKVDGKSISLTYSGLANGTYALKLFQDVDSDEKLGTNALGIPNEPFGFSNNAMGHFGPPSFEQAAFKVGSEPITIKVKLKG